MGKDDDLLSHADDPEEVLKNDIVHHLVSSLHISHLLDAVESALEGRWSVRGVEGESTSFVSLDEVSDIVIVRQGGGETAQSDRLLHLQTSGDSPRDETLQNKTTSVVEEMDFINDQAGDEVHDAVSLTCNNIPFLRGGYEDVSLSDLLLGQAHVSCELSHLNS